MENSIRLTASSEYQKIRSLFELFGFVVVGKELTWDQVDAWLLDLVYHQMRDAKENHETLYVQEFWTNCYSLCITAVRLGINEFDVWDDDLS